jgi:hypothetical protein
MRTSVEFVWRVIVAKLRDLFEICREEAFQGPCDFHLVYMAALVRQGPMRFCSSASHPSSGSVGAGSRRQSRLEFVRSVSPPWHVQQQARPHLAARRSAE